MRFAFLREKFQEAERAKEKEKRDVWTVRLGACVGLLNELTALRRETDEGEGEAEESEAEAKTRAARDRDLTLKFLNAEIAARSWLIDKTIQMKDFATATALTNEQKNATKRRFKITGDASRFETDDIHFRSWQTAIEVGLLKIEKGWRYQIGMYVSMCINIIGVLVALMAVVSGGVRSHISLYDNEGVVIGRQGIEMIKKAEELRQMKEEVLAQTDETIEKVEKVAEENRELRQKLAEAEAAKESEQTPPESAESDAAPTP